MTRVLLDPTGGGDVSTRPAAPRLERLAGATVGLLDISKPRGDVFLDTLEMLLAAQGATVHRYRKPTFSKPAPVDLRAEIAAQCGAVIEALAD